MSATESTTTTPPASTEKYQVLGLLGKGTFGKVLLIELESLPGEAVAMKEIEASGEHVEQITLNVKKEYILTKRLSAPGHENVIRFLSIRTMPEHYFLIMEYADGGDLFDKISSEYRLTSSQAHGYFKQLIAGLRYIHSKGVTHRDIKPENLMLTKAGVLKITDFGLGTLHIIKGEESLMDTRCGTPQYAAPEVLVGNQYRGPPVDIWSAGVVLINMLTGHSPWKKACKSDASYTRWFNDECTERDAWSDLGARVITLLCSILAHNPTHRAPIELIEQDHWFQFGDEETVEITSASSTSCNSEAKSSRKRKIEQTIESRNVFDYSSKSKKMKRRTLSA
ncbi:Protein kinase domain-containing protein [Caenorhabditis elegans]|uniref:Protein kinase domain-containing protein n=1 Tax=Caenorhabditis elegans TaxID=6239 RepID=H2KZK0_CAEEL|nr:Protein kinase domain-containing protein [Caenorhabditis elegans]CCD68545.2 Protein kinase domain-containing protein [Caenorhabditis elegans]|eukprot:NP_001023760.2 protein KINase [Caenorhabditis elegans]